MDDHPWWRRVVDDLYFAPPRPHNVIRHRCGHESEVKVKPGKKTDFASLEGQECPDCQKRNWRRK